VALESGRCWRLRDGAASKPERINSRVFAALCDILDCAPGELFEPVVIMEARATANAPDVHPKASGTNRGAKAPGVRRVRVVEDTET
jgi:hypothetical protein